MARALARELPGLAAHVVESALPEGEPAALPPAPAPGGVRWIFYSSGTTADPKGAQHTDASVGAAGRALAERLEAGPEDRNALVFPFTHIGGVAWLFAGLLAGFAQILVEVFDPKATVDTLARHGATLAGAGTVFHQAYLAAQRERGAAPVLPAVRAFPGRRRAEAARAPRRAEARLRRRRDRRGLRPHRAPDRDDGRRSAIPTRGSPTARAARPRGPRSAWCGRTARPRPPARRARSGCAAPTSAAATSTRALDAEAFDEAGFLRTGDLGHLDSGGYLVVSGRLKDVIIRKGENLSAKEIEDQLAAHPKLRDVAVVGLPDAERGERACAFVVPADPADPPTLAELASFLRARGLAAQKLPEQLELLAELPRNAAGKVLKRELRMGTVSRN